MPMPIPPSPQAGSPSPQMQARAQASPSQLLIQALDNLMKVGEMMSQSKAISPDELKQYGQIVLALKAFIEQNLNQSPNAPQPRPQGQAPSPMPMQAGGNPNARPAMMGMM